MSNEKLTKSIEILEDGKMLAIYGNETMYLQPMLYVDALDDIQSGNIPNGSAVVCTLTGHGLKDPDIAIKQSATEMITIDAELDSVKRAILDNL